MSHHVSSPSRQRPAIPGGRIAIAALSLAIGYGSAFATPPQMIDLNPMPLREPNADEVRESALRAIERRLRPRPLRPEVIEGWGAAVGMGPDAMEQLRDAIAVYRDNVGNLEIDDTDRFAAQLEATHRYDRRRRAFEPVYSPEYLRLLEMQWQSLEHIRSAERDLGATFLGLTPSPNEARARRLVFARLFEVVAVPTTRATAAINVAAIVDSMRLDERTWMLVEPLLETYVQRTGAALGWRTEAAFGLERERVRLLVELGPLWEVAADGQAVAEAREELAEIIDALVRTEVPISGLNEEVIETLSRALPPEQAEELRRRFWQLVNPEVYREELELTTIILRSMGNDGLHHQDVTGREALLGALQANLLRLGFAASDLEDVARTIDPTRSRTDALRHLAVELERLDALAQRRDAMLGAATSLESMLTTSEFAVLHDLRTWASAVRRRDAADRWIAERLAGVVARLTAPPPAPPPAPQQPIGAPDDPRGDAVDDGDPDAAGGRGMR